MNIKIPVNIKPFWISLIAVMMVVILSKLGFRPPNVDILNTFFEQNIQIVSPQSLNNNILETIKPKLEQNPSNFHLKRSSSFIQPAVASGDYDQAFSYLAVDFETGKILAEKNISTPTHIASLTKIMTAIVALDLASPEETFEVSYYASTIPPTKIGVVPGEKMRLDELLQGALMTSANDAVEVIKEGIDQKYGEEVFIKAMNEKAKLLGLKNTRFDNPQGFDSIRNFSSAEDLAIISQYALTNYPKIAEIGKKDYQQLPANNNHKQFDLYNWNGLLGVYPNVLGLKIGNTGWAQYTTSVVAQRQDKKVISILLGAPGVLERDLWASQLLDIGFEKLVNLPSVNINQFDLKQKYSTWKYWN